MKGKETTVYSSWYSTVKFTSPEPSYSPRELAYSTTTKATAVLCCLPPYS